VGIALEVTDEIDVVSDEPSCALVEGVEVEAKGLVEVGEVAVPLDFGELWSSLDEVARRRCTCTSSNPFPLRPAEAEANSDAANFKKNRSPRRALTV